MKKLIDVIKYIFAAINYLIFPVVFVAWLIYAIVIRVSYGNLDFQSFGGKMFGTIGLIMFGYLIIVGTAYIVYGVVWEMIYEFFSQELAFMKELLKTGSVIGMLRFTILGIILILIALVMIFFVLGILLFGVLCLWLPFDLFWK